MHIRAFLRQEEPFALEKVGLFFGVDIRGSSFTCALRENGRSGVWFGCFSGLFRRRGDLAAFRCRLFVTGTVISVHEVGNELALIGTGDGGIENAEKHPGEGGIVFGMGEGDASDDEALRGFMFALLFAFGGFEPGEFVGELLAFGFEVGLFVGERSVGSHSAEETPFGENWTAAEAGVALTLRVILTCC